MKTVVHLVRHGESEWNRQRRIQGQTESPLSSLGRTQAKAVGRFFEGKTIAALYTSDLGRAMETAAGFCQTVGLEPIRDARLREMNFGVLEGLTWQEAETNHPDVFARLRGGGPEHVIPEGESRMMLIERAHAVLGELAERHPGDAIIAVTHGGLKSYFLRSVLGVPYDKKPAYRTSNCSVSTFEYDESSWRLVTWGARHHLDGLDSL